MRQGSYSDACEQVLKDVLKIQPLLSQSARPVPNQAAKDEDDEMRVPESLSKLPDSEIEWLVKKAKERVDTDAYRHWASLATNHEGILVDPWINHGNPVVEAASIPVSRIVGYLFRHDLDSLLRDYPLLDREKVEQAVLYAVELLGG